MPAIVVSVARIVLMISWEGIEKKIYISIFQTERVQKGFLDVALEFSSFHLGQTTNMVATGNSFF